MTVEEFTTKKLAKLLGYLVGRYFVSAKRSTTPTRFTIACFNVITYKFFKEDWMVAVFAGSNSRFVSPVAKSEYISGFSLAVSVLDLTTTEAEKIGVLIPECAILGEMPDGSVSFGGMMLSRYPESR